MSFLFAISCCFSLPFSSGRDQEEEEEETQPFCPFHECKFGDENGPLVMMHTHTHTHNVMWNKRGKSWGNKEKSGGWGEGRGSYKKKCRTHSSLSSPSLSVPLQEHRF